MGSIKRHLDVLKSSSEEHVVHTDCYDVIVNRWDERELTRVIDSAPHLVMSVEPYVWPPGPWEQAYARLSGRYPWSAINGGQYCGRREQMIEVYEQMLVRWYRGDAKAGGSSQEILHQMYAEGYPFTLDLECRIFQSMFERSAPMVVLDGGVARNTVTGSVPMFLHFNGRAPGLGEWEAALTPQVERRETRSGPQLSSDEDQQKDQQNSSANPQHRLRQRELCADPVQSIGDDREDHHVDK